LQVEQCVARTGVVNNPIRQFKHSIDQAASISAAGEDGGSPGNLAWDNGQCLRCRWQRGAGGLHHISRQGGSWRGHQHQRIATAWQRSAGYGQLITNYAFGNQGLTKV
jgi:hypothetical protein